MRQFKQRVGGGPWGVLLAGWLLGSEWTYGQGLSLSEIEKQLATLSADNPADVLVRAQLQAAREDTERAAQLQERLLSLQTLQQRLPGDIAKLRDQLQRPEPVVLVEPATNMVALEAQIVGLQTQLQTAERQRDEFSQQLASLQNLVTAWQTESRQVQAAQAELRLRQATLSDGANGQILPQLTAWQARQQLTAIQEQLLDLERAIYDPWVSWLTAEQNVANRRIDALKTALAQLHTIRNERQREAAVAVVAQTQAHPPADTPQPDFLQEALAINNQLNQQLQQVTDQQLQIETQQLALNDQLRQLEIRSQRVNQQIGIAGFNEALGPILLAERQQLPNVSAYERDTRQRQRNIVAARLAQHEIDTALLNWHKTHQQLISDPRLKALPPDAQKSAREALLQRLSDRKLLYDRLQTSYGNLLNQWIALDQNQRRLIDLAAQNRQLLDRWLLWLPTAPRLDQAWRQFTWPSPLPPLLFPEISLKVQIISLIALILALMHRFWQYRLIQLADPIGKVGRDQLQYTLRALLVTLIMAAPLPLIFWAIFQESLTTISLFLLLTINLLFQPKGVGIIHFCWSPALAFPVRLVTYLLIIGWTALSIWQSMTPHWGTLSDVVRQTSHFSLQIAVSLLIFTTMGRIPQKNWQQWLFSLLWFPFLALGLLSALGYSYSADQIGDRLFKTFLLLVVGMLLLQLLLRSLSIAARKLAFQRALARREARQKDAETAINAMPDLSLQDINAQVRSLLNLGLGLGFLIGLWPIWGNLLPALEEIAFSTALGGKMTFNLGNLLISAAIFALIPLISTNLPGTLEILFTGLNSGSRYALVAILRYILVGGGIVMGLDQLGLPWSQLQWLVAAVGVGLGIGLQEIFANFVSGIILLLERPLRVGDTVTVDGNHGTVSRIRLRATTIVDWDNKEIVIPNKSLITGTVTNWTLSDNITRLVITVRIPYQADPRKAFGLLEAALQDNPTVLTEPTPTVWLRRFGDYSVEFEVFAFVAEIGDRFKTVHQLHLDFWHHLQAAGITIPFPQLELHMAESHGKWPLSAPMVLPSPVR